MQSAPYLHNALRHEYANGHIIYERLRLPPSVPITYKDFSPPIQTGTTCTTETRRMPNTHAHRRGCWPGYRGWVGKLLWQTNEEKGGREGAETGVLGKCLGGHINPSTKAV